MLQNGLKLIKNKLKLMYIIGITMKMWGEMEDPCQIILIQDHGIINIMLDLY